MKDPVVVVAKVIATKGYENELREGFLALVALAKTEPGFIQYDLHVSSERPSQFVFYEIWESEQSLDVHNNSEAMKTFGAKAEAWIQSVEIEKYTKIS